MEILALSTKPDPIYITIDGKKCNFKLDSPYSELMRHQSINRQIVEMSKGARTEKEDKKLNRLWVENLKCILDAPESVIESLSDLQKTLVLGVYNKVIKQNPQTHTTGNTMT